MEKRALQLEQRRVDALIPYDRNAREHPVAQVNKIARSIKQFGFNNPILVDANGVIVAGHGRLRAAKVLGMETVPVIVLGHLTEAERRAYTLADNRLPADAKWNKDLLAAELAAVASLPDLDFDSLGFSDAELDKLIGETDPNAAAPLRRRQRAAQAASAATRAPAVASTLAPPELLVDGRINLHCGDCLPVLSALPADSHDSCASDPPYGLGREPDALEMLRAWLDGGHYDVRSASGFMGKEWDAFVPQPAVWREVYRVLKPGAHVVAFFGTRTYDLGVLAMRTAGFEVRDLVAWLYGQGFPKSLNVALEFEQRLCRKVERGDASEWVYLSDGADMARVPPFRDADANAWAGFGVALKPAIEPIVLARKPLAGSVAANVLQFGTGALNIDGCKVATVEAIQSSAGRTGFGAGRDDNYELGSGRVYKNTSGRWPANVVHDGSGEVVEAFPVLGVSNGGPSGPLGGGIYNNFAPMKRASEGGFGDHGSAARFFYAAKADRDERLGSKHPTVKPVDLMQWLVRLVTPPGGIVLDPFAGTGTTGEAAIREGFRATLIEREADYQADIRRRLENILATSAERGELAAALRGGGGRQIYGRFADERSARSG